LLTHQYFSRALSDFVRIWHVHGCIMGSHRPCNG